MVDNCAICRNHIMDLCEYDYWAKFSSSPFPLRQEKIPLEKLNLGDWVWSYKYCGDTLLVDWTFLSFMVFIFTTENTKHIFFEVKVTEIKTLNLEISRQIASNLFSPARSLHMNSSRYPGWLMWCGLATLSVNKAEGKLPSWSLAGLYSIPLWFNHLCVDTGFTIVPPGPDMLADDWQQGCLLLLLLEWIEMSVFFYFRGVV